MDRRLEQMKAKEQALSHEYLVDVLEYDPEVGLFIWKKPVARRIKPGMVAGALNKNGYLFIKVGKYIYRAHRLAWFYFYGEWPPTDSYQIDHIDGNRLNNSIHNLRLVTNTKNAKNHGLYKHNTSGVSGICFCTLNGKWKASIVLNQKRVHLGYYNKFEDAVAARKQAEKEYGFICRE